MKYPHQLCGGQRQRVSIARALTVDPRVIVADEAVSMVDVSIRISLLNLLLALRDEFGVTFVLITHDLAVARYFAWRGRIGVMYLGRVVELGTSELVVGDPAHPYTAALVAAIPEADPTLTRNKERVRAAQRGGAEPAAAAERLHVPPALPALRRGLCDVQVPELLPIPDGRQVACHVAARERAPARRAARGALVGPGAPARQPALALFILLARAHDPAVPGPLVRRLRGHCISGGRGTSVHCGGLAARAVRSRRGCRPKKMTNRRRRATTLAVRANRRVALSPRKEKVDD